MRYAVIMAGGPGRRLWPISRTNRPKQLLPLIGGKDLLSIAVERLAGVFENENILVITNAEYADQVVRALPQLPQENIVGEPDRRDTAVAIALAAELLAARDEDATMAMFTADHIIRPKEEFVRCVGLACEAAEANSDALVTFGIRPSWPHTGLGYVECDKALRDGLYEVRAFKEKPDHQAARRYVESGKHYWNSGMFVWKLTGIRQALEEFLPQSLEKLAPVGRAARDGKDYTGMLKEIYPTLEKISIDYAVMEKAAKVLMVELTCQWLDVGDWPALADVSDLDEGGNAVVAENVALLDSFRNVIVSDNGHLLAVVGMDDCIVVHSCDATLVCNKSDSQRLKQLVAMLEEKYGSKYL